MKELYLSFKASRWFPLVVGILFVVFGILFLMNPEIEMQTMAMYLGIIVLCYGVFYILAGLSTKDNKSLKIARIAAGVVIAVLAILIFVNVELIGKYLPTLVGFFMILGAIVNLFRSVVLMKNGLKSWWAGAVPALVVCILGLIFLLKPGFVGAVFGLYAGITFILCGISALIAFAQFKK